VNLTINGTSLHVVESGDPSGIPVIFIHGFPFSHTMWRPQLQSLPPKVRAIAYDVRGHGMSDVGDGQYSIELFVDDLMGLMDGLSIPRAALCGLSMGGYIALRAVERHADRITGLVLADTRSDADGNEAKVKRTASLKSVKADGSAAFGRNFVKAVFWEGSFSRTPDAVEMIRTVIAGNSPLGIGGTLLALAARTDTTESLNAIRVPTVILVGEHDVVTPPAAARAMHERIIGSQMFSIPDAAHMSNLENPAAFNRHLHEFLARLA
jgi:3-oxoadipate enol-lactonase